MHSLFLGVLRLNYQIFTLHPISLLDPKLMGSLYNSIDVSQWFFLNE